MGKVHFLLLLIFMFSFGVQGQSKLVKNKFILSGELKGINEQYLIFSYTTMKGDRVKDSVLILKEKFQFEGYISEPARAFIYHSNPSKLNGNSNFAWIFIEPVKMKISIVPGKFNELKLEGSKTQDELVKLNKMLSIVTDKTGPIFKEYNTLTNYYSQRKKDGAGKDELLELENKLGSLREEMDSYSGQSRSISNAFYKKHPNSFVTIYNLTTYARSYPYTELADYYSSMSMNVKKSQAGLEFKKILDKIDESLPGKMAPGFVSIDLSGDSLKLSSFQGKYVMLDFWATWCKPCRAENPKLIELYKKYRGEKLEFIGIADDDRRVAEWKTAIEKDGISIWKQILSGKQGETEKGISGLFNVYLLPTKILINPDGVIIGRYEGDEDKDKFYQQLDSLFLKE